MLVLSPVPHRPHRRWLLALGLGSLSLTVNALKSNKIDFYDPRSNGGQWLTVEFHLPLGPPGAKRTRKRNIVPNTYPEGLGEPLNLVVSANSDPDVLSEDMIKDWMESVGFSFECGGFTLGSRQAANLGDGNGVKNQTGIYRWAYGQNALGGTCLESLDGGNHVRYWIQNGHLHNTGAVFMAVSAEENSTLGHDILKPDGYSTGRDWFLGNASRKAGTTSPRTGIVYKISVNNGYLQPGSNGINHGLSIDGKVAVVTLEIADLSATIMSPWAIPTFLMFILFTALGGWVTTVWMHPSHDYSHLPEHDSNIVQQRRKQADAMLRKMSKEYAKQSKKNV
ncbi:hypothetical protein T439DRAFT_376898 [Meredithblackwellia eburnea MCA 4105]